MEFWSHSSRGHPEYRVPAVFPHVGKSKRSASNFKASPFQSTIMRTLNVRRTIVLLIVVIVVAGSTHLLHSVQVQRNSSSYKIQAEAAWNDKPRRLLDAIVLMRVYLILEPKDYKAREELGFWYIGCGQFPAATGILEELLRVLEKQTPPDVPWIQRVRRKAIDAALGQPPDGISSAVFHLEILKKELPRDVGVLNMLGKCKITLGREADAIKNFSEAIQLAPDRVDIYYNKAMALRFPPVQQLPEAEKCMAEMIAVPANAKSAGAHHIYGMWFEELGKHAEALKQAEATLALQKDHRGGLYLAGQSELALGNYAKAAEYARRGIKVAPQEVNMYTLMADVLVHGDRRDKAIEVLKQGVASIPSKGDKARILWHLANLYLDGHETSDTRNRVDAKNIAEAVDCMRRMRDYRFSPVQMAFLDARVLYGNEDWKAARGGFEKVRSKLNDFPQLMKCLDYWIGYCYLQQGNPDQAKAAFRRSLHFDKFYFKARDGMARIFSSEGQLADAAEEYRQAVIGNPADVEAWRAWARTLVLWNLQRDQHEQNWDEVNHVLIEAQERNPHDGQIKLLAAEMFLARGQTKEAADLLKRLHEDSPEDADFWVAEVRLTARRGDTEQAKKILDEARRKLGDQVLIRLTRALIALRELNFQAGAPIEALAGDAEAFSVEEKTRLWNGLLSNLLEIREYERAKRLCRLIAREQPHDAIIRYRLFELALVTHDARDPAASLAELDRVLEEIDGIAGQGPLWMYGKAVRLKLEAQQGKPELLDKAMDCASEAQRMRLTWSRPHVLKGEICRQRGNQEEALEHYLQASINGDRDLEFIRLLLQMLFERQRYQEAEQVIHRLETSPTPLTPDVLAKEAEIYAVGGDFDRALDCARQAYDPASGDYREHVWHGQVLNILARRAQREGHQDKLAGIAAQAEKSLRRACQIAPNAADCRVELVRLLMATDQRAKAEIAADDAREMISSQAAPLAMGQIYEALGKAQQAGQCYEKAIKTRPDNSLAIRNLADHYLRNRDLQRATPLIERLLSGTVQASESDLVSARRMKASILLTEGYPKLKEAIDLIDRNLASQMGTVQDKRIKIRLLLADPRQVYGPEVLDLAESLVKTGGAEPDPDDRLALAGLYLARDNWERCQDQMEKLVNGSQNRAKYLAAYVGMLMDKDQLTDAEERLDRLQRIANPGLTVPLRAELLYRRKQWAKVPDFLAAYVDQENAEPKDRLDRVLIAARLLEDFGSRLTAHAQREQAQSYFEAARRWYESYVGQRGATGGAPSTPRPGRAEMLLAGFHARRGEISAALDVLNQFGGKAPPLDLRNAAVDVIRCETVTSPQLLQAEKILDNAAAAQKESIPLLNARIVLKISQEKFADAAALCREMIAKDPKNFRAYSNLGVLLAFGGNKPDEALTMVNRAIELAGPLPSLLDNRAVVHLARKEARQALEDLKSITADKIDPIWLFHKARAFLLSGQAEPAAAALAEARSKGLERAMLDPPERPLYDRLQEQLARPKRASRN